MRIGTRLTLTTSLLVAVTLGIYGYVTIRSFREQQRGQLEKQAHEFAIALRAAIEAEGFDRFAEHAAELYQGAEVAGSPWELELLDAREAPPPDAPEVADPWRERLRKVIAIKAPLVEETIVGGRRSFVYLEPVRAPSSLSPTGFRVVGAIQLTRETEFLEDEVREQRFHVITSMMLLISVLVLVISLLTRQGIGRPISQLIAGIDDVAKGDLSRVLLQERDDEIGALAARFNAMTASLREAQAEKQKNLDQLRRSEKLAIVGELAAEIAHEVGTPLNVVTGRARTMAKKADDPEAVQKNATIIAEQAARITRIIQRLLDFARRGASDQERAPVDLNRLAQDTLEFLDHHIANARVEPRTHLEPTLGPIMGHRDQLQQVLLNLCMNALQAMPEGGELTVGTGRVLRRRPGLELAPEQGYAYLWVADTGPGIPAADRERIFEPFYTSKGDAGGTGLGLAVANGIVKEHDGWIEIDENAAGGKGALFRVYLPLGSEAASLA
ncbi:MAG: HAMP domain-containing protein [Deltaproteobacteria bacterium]|nr:HAMP domain-containing protein [Deltaproteobacteria bacterium]